MRNLLMAGTAGLFLALGAAGASANAQNLDVHSTSAHAIRAHSVAPASRMRRPMIEGRAAYTNLRSSGVHAGSAYTLDNPEGPLNDFYKGVGLSDDVNDCNNGCAGGTGG